MTVRPLYENSCKLLTLRRRPFLAHSVRSDGHAPHLPSAKYLFHKIWPRRCL